MYNKNSWAVAHFIIFSFSCSDDDATQPTETGTFQVFFDNKIVASEVTLREPGNVTTYDYETASGQKFNLSELGYYISEIKLEGRDGALYEDEMTANASEAKGYYLIREAVSGSGSIMLENVPAGKYDRITFTLGVKEEGITEGAVGGSLDPAGDAALWFWRWNSGYIFFKMEGTAENSGQEYIDFGGGFEALENTFGFHVGGWKEVEADDVFANNVKTITLDLQGAVNVSPELSPLAHVIVDPLKVLDGANVDFSTTFSIHSPVAGQPLAEELTDIFLVHHVHQSTQKHD
ncbi:MAG: MbnP family protein [Bacteroidota bacterium]